MELNYPLGQATLGQYDPELLTEQQVFDIGAAHLLTQNKKSMIYSDGDEKCKYNGAGKACCGAAPFIQGYSSEMEGRSYSQLVYSSQRGSKKFDLTLRHVNLIQGLQRIHDTELVENWKQRLKTLARENHVSDAILADNSIKRVQKQV